MIGMNRRSFLKFAGFTGVTLSFNPFTLIKQITLYDHFNPAHQWGNVYKISDYTDREILGMAWEIISPEIQRVIPPRYRHKITFHRENPKPNTYNPLAQYGWIDWIYTP
jgi:hypothetical protein